MNNRLLYAPLGFLLKGLSLLPFGALYALSDALCFITRDVIGYRRKVVRDNLAQSFPDLPESERRKIEREFYRNLTDLFVETVKLLHISDSEMKKRMEFRDTEIIDRFLEEGRSVCIYFSHIGNWEWATSVTLWSRYILTDDKVKGGQVYRPLKNRWFDNWYLRLRNRFGSVCYPKRTVFRDLIKARREGILTVTGFMSDQKPSHGDPTYITTFLNHPTAMITGTETLARKLDMAAVYWDMEKVGRGHYRITIRILDSRPSQLPPMDLTARYTRMLETTIRRQPSIWLWTHRRWKIPVTLPDTSKAGSGSTLPDPPYGRSNDP